MKTKNNWITSRILGVLALSLLVSACATTQNTANMTEQTGELFLEPGNLNVSLKATAGDGAYSEDVKAIVAKDLRRELIQKGYRMDESSPMIEVGIEVSADALDETGNYYTLDGEARLEVVGAYSVDRPVLGSEAVTVEGVRTLGKSKAQAALSREMSEALGDAMKTALENGAKQIRVVTISVTLGWFSLKDARAYPATFVREVSALDGILDCVLLKNDLKTRTSVYQVVQEAGAFPQGLETVLAEMKALKIR